MAVRSAQPRTAARPRPSLAARVAPESFQEFIRRQASHSTQRSDALAMYEDVAREPEVQAVSEPAMQAEYAMKPPVAADPPAVFRRRPSRLTDTAAAVPAARSIAVQAAVRVQGDEAPALVEPDLYERMGRSSNAADWVGDESLPAALVRPVAVLPASVADAPAQMPLEAASAAPIAAVPPAPTPPPKPVVDETVMAELQMLRSALTDRISHLEKQIVPVAVAPRQDDDAGPLALKRQAMTRLLMSGFSPELARRLAESVPPTLDRKETEPWLQTSLAQLVRCPADVENAIYLPGAVALVGPTGVGKTTTIAKLAARFVVRHGASALGLVTLDSYRIGAHEQLRSYGRILGVPVQAAHDAASLRDLLRSMHGKRMVLIDTCGMSQRDQRLGEMLAMLSEARFNDQEIRRVLLVNAASHAETLDEVARAWRVSGAHGAILTKLDEAARIGGGLDALIRYQLPLLGLTNGQRVPEDWHPGNAGLLAHIALKPFAAAFCLDNTEIQALTSKGAALV
jgi:flagellar biosynthesis protein FlhF